MLSIRSNWVCRWVGRWLMCRAYTKQRPVFYVLNANVVVKTWKCHEQRCRLNQYTAWSILQGLKIINVLCFEWRILLFMVSQPWRRRSVCLKSLLMSEKQKICARRGPSQHQNAAHYKRFEVWRVSKPYLDLLWIDGWTDSDPTMMDPIERKAGKPTHRVVFLEFVLQTFWLLKTKPFIFEETCFSPPFRFSQFSFTFYYFSFRA